MQKEIGEYKKYEYWGKVKCLLIRKNKVLKILWALMRKWHPNDSLDKYKARVYMFKGI